MDGNLTQPLLPSRVDSPEEANGSSSVEENLDVGPSSAAGITHLENGNGDHPHHLHGDLMLPSSWSPLLGCFSEDWVTVRFSSDCHKSYEWIATERCIPEEASLFYFEVSSVWCPKKCTMVLGFVDSNAIMQARYTEPKNLAMAYWCYASLLPKNSSHSEKGDVFGCILDRKRSSISLTKNGVFLEKKFERVNSGPLWPAIGLRSACQVRANFGDSEFSFNISDRGNGRWHCVEGMRFDSGFPKQLEGLKSFACVLSNNGLQAQLTNGGKIKANFPVPTQVSKYKFQVSIIESTHPGRCEVGFMALDPSFSTSVFSRLFLTKKGDVLGVELNRCNQNLKFTVNGEEICVGHLVLCNEFHLWPFFEALDPITVMTDFFPPQELLPGSSQNSIQDSIQIKSFRGTSFPDSIPRISPLHLHKSNAILRSVELKFPQHQGTNPQDFQQKLVLLSPSKRYAITRILPSPGIPPSLHQIEIWEMVSGNCIGHVPILPEILLKDYEVPEGRALRVKCVEWISEGEVLLISVAWRMGSWVVAWNVGKGEVEWNLDVGIEALCSVDTSLDRETICIRKGPHLRNGILLYSLQNRPNPSRLLKAFRATRRGLNHVDCFPGGEIDPIDQGVVWDLKTIARQIAPDTSSLLAGAYLFPLDAAKPHKLIKVAPFRAVHHVATWSSDSLFAASWRPRQNSIYVLDVTKCKSDSLAGLPVECQRLMVPDNMLLSEKAGVKLLKQTGTALRAAATIQSSTKACCMGCIWDVKTGDPIMKVDLGEKPRPCEAAWWVIKTPSEFRVIDKFSAVEIGRSCYDQSKLNFWPNENSPATTRNLEEHRTVDSMVIWTVGEAFSRSKTSDDATTRTVSFEGEGDVTMCRLSPDGSKVGVAILGRESSVPSRRESVLQIWDLESRMAYRIPLVRLNVGLTPDVAYIEDPLGESYPGESTGRAHTVLWGRKFKRVCSHFDFAKDGKKLVTWDASTSVRLWSLDRGFVHPLKELGKVQGNYSQSDYMWGQDGLRFIKLCDGGEGVASLGTTGITRFDEVGGRMDTHPEKAVDFARFTHGGTRALLFLAQDRPPTPQISVEVWDLGKLELLQRGNLGKLANGPNGGVPETCLDDALDPEALLELARTPDGCSQKAATVWPVGCESPILFGRDPRKKVKPQDPDYAIPGAFSWNKWASKAYVDTVVNRSDYQALKQFVHSFNVFAGIRDGSRIAWVRRDMRARTFNVIISLTYGGSEIPTWYEDLLDLDEAALRNRLISKINGEHGCSLLNQPVFADGRSILLESVSRGHAKIVEQIVQVALAEAIPVMFSSRRALDDGENANASALQLAVDLGFPQIAKILMKHMLMAGPSEVSQNGTVMSRILTKFLQRHPTGADFRSVFHSTIASAGFCYHLGNVLVPNDLFSAEAYLVGLHHHCTVLPWQTNGLLGLQREIHKRLAEYGDERYANAVKIQAKALVIPAANFVTEGSECVLRHLQQTTPNGNVFSSFTIDALVRYKWENGCKHHAIFEFLAYMCLLLSFTLYSLMVGSRRFDPEDFCPDEAVAVVFLVISGTIASLHLIEEVGQLWKYINDIDPGVRDKWVKVRSRISGLTRYVFQSKWNALEFVTYVLVAAVIPLLHCSPDYLHVVVAITNIALWWKTLYYMQIFSHTAPLVLAIFMIINDMISLVLLGSIVLFGFGLAYFVLLHPEPGEDVDLRFGTMLRSIYSVFTMLLGYFDLTLFEDLENSGTIATLMFVVFVLGMVVVLLNLLIAIMSDSFNRIRRVQDSAFIQAKARIIEDVETSIFYRRREFPPYMHILIPGHEGAASSSASPNRQQQLQSPSPHRGDAPDDCIQDLICQLGCLNERLMKFEARIENMDSKQDEGG